MRIKTLNAAIALILISSQLFSQTLLKENKLKKESHEEYIKTDACTGEIYTNNISKVVFGKSIIDPTGSTSQLVSEFNLGDPVSVCIILPTALGNYVPYSWKGEKDDDKVIDNISTFVYIDNKEAFDSDAQSTSKKPEGEDIKKFQLDNINVGDKKARPFIRFTLNSSSNGGALNSAFIKALNDLPNGKHTIYVNIEANTNGGQYLVKYPVARGQFTIVKGENSKVSLGRKFSDIKSWMTDPTLEAKALKIMKEYQATTGATQFRKPNLTADQLKIVGNDWIIIKNPGNSFPTSRILPCAVPIKDEKGDCGVMIIGVVQAFDGTGYSKNFSSAVNLNPLDFPNVPRRIDCE